MSLVPYRLPFRLVALIALGSLACEVYTPELLEPVSVEEPGPDPTTQPSGSSPNSPSEPGPNEPDPVEPTPDPDDSTPPAPDVTGAPSDSPSTPPTEPTSAPDPDPSTPAGPEPTPTLPGTSPTPGPDASAPVGPEPAPTGTAPSEPQPETPSDNPLIADFEGNSEQLAGGHREGYWFSDGASGGSITDVEDVFSEAPAGNGAVHILASGYGAMDWATFGVDFNDGTVPPAYVQAAQYDGIRFWACTGDSSGMSELFFEVVTLDTSKVHEESNEDNHYRARLDLDDQWTQYEFAWDDLEQTWGTKSPVFDIDGVIGLRFSLEAAGFDLWLDNVEFIEGAMASVVTEPPSGSCPVTLPADAGAP